MKLKVILTLLLLTGAAKGMVQSQTQFGIRAGFNLSDINDDHNTFPVPEDAETVRDLFVSRPAFHLGVFAEWPLGRNFFAAPELNYHLKGGRYHPDLNGPDGPELRVDLHYLTLPLLVHYRLDRLRFELGPEFGYRLASDWWTSEGDAAFVERNWDFSAFDLGATAGLHYQFNRFRFGLRFTNGLLPIDSISITDSNGDEIKEGSFRNANWQLTAAWLLFQRS